MNTKKLIAPIIITFVILAYLMFWMITVAITAQIIAIPWFIYALTLIIPVGSGIAIICALLARIKEIKRGEEDDVSKY